MAVKRIRDEADYKSGGNSDFIGLDEGEKFIGHFLGQADPKIDDPAFFPYKMHWNGKTSVPCADEDCIFCEDGDRPRSKAYTLWLVLTDEAGKKLGKKGEGEFRIFDMPVTVIKQFNERRAEGDKVQGVVYRVSRIDEKTYSTEPKTNISPLTKKAITELLKSDDAPDFEQMLNNKLKKAMEGTAVARALEDDEEDEKPQKSGDKAEKKGKGKPAPEPEDDDDETTEAGEWPAEGLDEETVVVAKIEKKGQWIDVTSDSYEDSIKVWTTDDIGFDLTDLSVDDEVTITTSEKDDDGEYVLSDEPVVEEAGDPEPDPDAPEGDLPDEIAAEEMEVTEVDAANSTIDVKNDEMEFTLYFLDTMPVDFDDYAEGDKITVTAEKDRAGDLVATEVPEKVGGKKKPAAKKGGKKSPAKGKKKVRRTT